MASLDAAEYPVSNKRLSELFVWKIQRDLLQDERRVRPPDFDTQLRCAVGRSISCRVGEAHKARRHGKVYAHFRYRLFKGARSPTLAIFAENREPNNLDSVWVYSPLLTSQPIGEAGHLWSIIVSDSDVEPYKLRDLCQSPESWFWALILRPYRPALRQSPAPVVATF